MSGTSENMYVAERKVDLITHLLFCVKKQKVLLNLVSYRKLIKILIAIPRFGKLKEHSYFCQIIINHGIVIVER